MPDETPSNVWSAALVWAGTAVFALLSVFTVYLALRTISMPVKVICWVMTALDVQFILLLWHWHKKQEPPSSR